MSVYNNEDPELLYEAFRSILNQTILPTEFVLIEDGKINIYLNKVIIWFTNASHDKGILVKIIKNPKNIGLGLSLRKGVLESNYNWIARFDSDDVNDIHRMEKTLNYINNHNKVAIVGGYAAEFNKNIKSTNPIRKVPSEQKEIYKMSKFRNPFNHMTVTLNRECVLAAGNYENVPYFEDYYLWLKIISQKRSLFNLKKILVYAHVDDRFYYKRSGLNYFRKELNFQLMAYNNKLINLRTLIFNTIIRGPIRVFPKFLLKVVYKLLRYKSVY